MKQKSLILSTLLFFVTSIVLFLCVYSVQSKPFIDEIFHIPQTIKYCRGNFDEVLKNILFSFYINGVYQSVL